MASRLADGGMPVALADAAGQNPVLRTRRCPTRGRGRAEKRNGSHAQSGGKMQRAGVAGNKRCRTSSIPPETAAIQQSPAKFSRPARIFSRPAIKAASRSPRAVVKTSWYPACQLRDGEIPPRCAVGHSFFGWLDATWQMMASSAGEVNFPGGFRSSASGRAGFPLPMNPAQRDLPAGHAVVPAAWIHAGDCSPGPRGRCRKIFAPKTAGFRPAEPPRGPDKKTQDRPTVIARKIHRAVKVFAAQGADQRHGFREDHASRTVAASARPRLDPRKKVLKQRRDFLRHQQVNFALRKIPAQGAERGCHQHGVAEVFELQREDFFRPRAHDANCSSYSFW